MTAAFLGSKYVLRSNPSGLFLTGAVTLNLVAGFYVSVGQGREESLLALAGTGTEGGSRLRSTIASRAPDVHRLLALDELAASWAPSEEQRKTASIYEAALKRRSSMRRIGAVDPRLPENTPAENRAPPQPSPAGPAAQEQPRGFTRQDPLRGPERLPTDDHRDEEFFREEELAEDDAGEALDPIERAGRDRDRAMEDLARLREERFMRHDDRGAGYDSDGEPRVGGWRAGHLTSSAYGDRMGNRYKDDDPEELDHMSPREREEHLASHERRNSSIDVYAHRRPERSWDEIRESQAQTSAERQSTWTRVRDSYAGGNSGARHSGQSWETIRQRRNEQEEHRDEEAHESTWDRIRRERQEKLGKLA